MRLLCITLILVSAASVAHATAERDVVKTFPAGAHPSVVIDTFRGAITVTEADTTDIRVAVHLEIGGDTPAETDELLRTLELTIEQAAGVVRASAKDAAQTGPRFDWNAKKQIQPTFRVTVPAHCDVNLQTRKGPIIVGNLSGTLVARSRSGDVFLRTVSGNVNAESEAGDVVVSRCIGSVRARARDGTVRVGTITGPVDAECRNGDVELLAPESDVHAFAEVGTVTISLPHRFNGHAEIATSGGGIVAQIDPRVRCRIEASASLLAHVEFAKLPLKVASGASGSRHLVATLNDGTALVHLKASGGNVRIVPGKTSFEDTGESPDSPRKSLLDEPSQASRAAP
jgi:hypothetical protein